MQFVLICIIIITNEFANSLGGARHYSVYVIFVQIRMIRFCKSNQIIGLKGLGSMIAFKLITIL